MEPIFLNLQSQLVAVYQSRPNGPAILMLHGNSLGGATYFPLFKEPALAAYRLITFDWPGCGESPCPSDPDFAYTPAGWSALLMSMLDALCLKKVLIVGHSLGALHALQAMTMGLAEKTRGLLICGIPELKSATMPAEAGPAASDWDEAAIQQAAQALVRPGGQVPDKWLDLLRAADPKRRAVAAKLLASPQRADDMMVMSWLPFPLAVVQGNDEPPLSARYFSRLPRTRLWRGDVQQVAAAGHSPQAEQPVLFAELLASYANNMSAVFGATANQPATVVIR